ncbi:MAG: CHAT domain-containing protein [Paludibacteraceae bacterium]|nr:CHAT domain-containing protein [Paludibacteraceae bacterium]
MKKIYLLTLFICMLPLTWSSAHSTKYYQQIVEQSEKLYAQGDISGALQITEDAVTKAKVKGDTLSNVYARILHNRAVCYYDIEQYNVALREIRRCIYIRKKILNPFDEQYIHSALIEASVLSAMGNYAQRDSAYAALLNDTKEYPYLYYWICSEQVQELYRIADYEQVIRYGENTIIRLRHELENVYDSQENIDKYSEISPDDILLIYQVVANSYHELRNYPNAIDWIIQVITYKQNMLNLSDADCLTEYHNLAQFYNSVGDCTIAKHIGEFVVHCREKNKDAAYARSAHVLSSAYAHCEDIDSAIIYAESALETKEKVLGKTTDSYNLTLRNLACYYAIKGDFEKAINYSKSALDFYSNVDNIDAGHLQNIASFYTRADVDSAVIYRDCSAIQYQKEMITTLSNLTFNERQTYLFDETQKIRTLLWSNSDLRYIDNDAYNKTSYNIALLINSICVGIENKLAEYIGRYGNDSIKTQYVNLKTLQQARKRNAGYSLAYQIKQLEYNILTSISHHRKDYLSFLKVTCQNVQEHLQRNDIGIEFSYSDNPKSYFALILRKDWEAPKCVILGEEAQLDSLPYSKLQQTVWQAIIDSAQIKEGENIYFAPDGIFYNIPIEYLPTADGQSMSDKYNMFRVSSTRELCFRDSTSHAYSSAVLYGGLKYDAAPQQNLYAQNLSGYRGLDNMSETVWTQWRAEDRAKYNYLPYTLKEVDSISTTIHNALQVTTYTDVYGDEKSFKALSGNSPSILHVATHGYYITPTQAEVMSRERLAQYGVSPTDERQSVIDYSMERTGLLLAGAQYTLRGVTLPQDADDGILSAKEISHLDLTNTDLVVLSACKTALGDVTNDGVAGLQRGFKIAGVKSVLMSLWQVDDAATYLLMKRFYQSLVSGKSKQQALREAQQALRSYKTQDDYPYSDIRYWGAFVLLDAIE